MTPTQLVKTYELRVNSYEMTKYEDTQHLMQGLNHHKLFCPKLPEEEFHQQLVEEPTYCK